MTTLVALLEDVLDMIDGDHVIVFGKHSDHAPRPFSGRGYFCSMSRYESSCEEGDYIVDHGWDASGHGMTPKRALRDALSKHKERNT